MAYSEDIKEHSKNKLVIELEVEMNDYISGYIRGYIGGFKKGSSVDRDKDSELIFITKLTLKGNKIADYEFCEIIKNKTTK